MSLCLINQFGGKKVSKPFLFLGIDCGPVLSVVTSAEQPNYEIYGNTCLRAYELMRRADCYGIMVSEEIFLALRPRDFSFDPRPLKISQDLTAYVFDDCYPEENNENETRAATLPVEQTTDTQNEVNKTFRNELYFVI